jgi:hypothetical protein
MQFLTFALYNAAKYNKVQPVRSAKAIKTTHSKCKDTIITVLGNKFVSLHSDWETLFYQKK